MSPCYIYYKRLFFPRTVRVKKKTTVYPPREEPFADEILIHRGPVRAAEGFAHTHVSSRHICTYNAMYYMRVCTSASSVDNQLCCTMRTHITTTIIGNNMCYRGDWWPPPYNMHTDSWPWLIWTINRYYYRYNNMLCAAHLRSSPAAYYYSHNVSLLCATGYTFWRSQ